MISIREFEEQDRASLKQLYLDIRRSTFDWVDPSLFHLDDFETDTEGEKIFVAIVEKQIAGFLSLWVQDSYIHHLYVNEKCKRTGIGRALIDKATGLLTPPIRLKVPKKNTRAVGFYQHLGWKQVSEGTSDDTGGYYLFQFG